MTNASPPPAVEPGPVDQPAQHPRPPRNEVLDFGRLRRSNDDRRIAGVAAGLARHLDIDPIIVRVTLVVMVFFGGSGLLLYAAAWLLVPEEGSPSKPLGLDDRNRNVALITVGVLAALAAVGDFAGAFWFPWPLVIVGLLVVWFLRRSEKGPRPPGQWSGEQQPYPPYDPTAYARPRNPRKQGPILFWFTLAMLATAIGTLGFIDVSGADVPAAGYPALGLAITGLMLALGAFWGRAGGLILIGLVLAPATLVTSLSAHHEDERVVFAPSSAAEVRNSYDFGAGELLVDLSGVQDVEGLDGRVVTVDAALGELEVVVPAGMDVSVEASTGAGGVELFGEDTGGVGGLREGFVDGGTRAPEMRIIIDLGVGQVTVREQ